MPAPLLRLGTRGSPLALAQAEETRSRLAAAHGVAPDAIAIVVIKTTGDRIQDRPLSEAGGKGLFTKEIEEALQAGAVDCAVHSAKDVPTWHAAGLGLIGALPRVDPRDALIARNARAIEDLPDGAVVGTASLRRGAQIRRLRPDLRVVTFRGNVETRLRKLEAGEVDATLLAMAGLTRLGLTDVVTTPLPAETFLPAVGQGIIALEARVEDTRTRDLVAPILDGDATIALACERAYLAELDGSCRTPIAGHAEVRDGAVVFRGEVLLPDGSEAHAVEDRGAAPEAALIGQRAGARLKATIGAGFLAALA